MCVFFSDEQGIHCQVCIYCTCTRLEARVFRDYKVVFVSKYANYSCLVNVHKYMLGRVLEQTNFQPKSTKAYRSIHMNIAIFLSKLGYQLRAAFCTMNAKTKLNDFFIPWSPHPLTAPGSLGDVKECRRHREQTSLNFLYKVIVSRLCLYTCLQNRVLLHEQDTLNIKPLVLYSVCIMNSSMYICTHKLCLVLHE